MGSYMHLQSRCEHWLDQWIAINNDKHYFIYWDYDRYDLHKGIDDFWARNNTKVLDSYEKLDGDMTGVDFVIMVLDELFIYTMEEISSFTHKNPKTKIIMLSDYNPYMVFGICVDEMDGLCLVSDQIMNMYNSYFTTVKVN